jgi:hypothetical protein
VRLLFLSLASCLLLVSPALADPDPFADFRIPDHSWTSGAASASLGTSHMLDGAGMETDRSSSTHSALATSLSRAHDSDALQHRVSLTLSGEMVTQDSRSAVEYPFGSDRMSEYARDVSEDWQVSGSLRAYPWRIPLGIELSGHVVGDYFQDAARRDTRSTFPVLPGTALQEQRETRAAHAYQNLATLDVAAGLGRVRDASVVYDVHLLEERLQEAGALTRPLSDAAREKLAALEYVAPFYSIAHDRPARFVWHEIERILREDGALREQGLDAYSLLRALEGTGPVGRPARPRGWFCGAVAEARTQHLVTRIEERFDSRVTTPTDTLENTFLNGLRTVSSYDAVSLGGQAEYHRPLGWRWQLDAFGRLLGPVRPGERGLDLETSAQAQWFVADRWAARATISQARLYFYPRRSEASLIYPTQPRYDRWIVAYSASIAFYLEDRTTLSASLLEQQDRETYPGTHHFGRYGRLDIGITYRFLGSLDAPGLIEPVRRVH